MLRSSILRLSKHIVKPLQLTHHSNGIVVNYQWRLIDTTCGCRKWYSVQDDSKFQSKGDETMWEKASTTNENIETSLKITPTTLHQSEGNTPKWIWATEDQKMQLETYFEENMYPDKVKKEQIALQLNLSKTWVDRWFKKKRSKSRSVRENASRSKDAVKWKRLTTQQKLKLESYYEENSYPELEEKEKIAEELNLPKKRVDSWFNTRRVKSKDISEGSKVPKRNPAKLITAAEKEQLEKLYEEVKFPDQKLRKDISLELGLSERQVNQWFKKRRVKAMNSEEVKSQNVNHMYDQGHGHEETTNIQDINISSEESHVLSEKSEGNYGEGEILEKQAPEDTFGTLAEEIEGRNAIPNYSLSNPSRIDEDDKPYRRLAESRKHTPVYYGRQIEKLAKDGKIYEAIDVLETRMLIEDRVMPTEYVFTCLIGALGRAGYTKKAFHLYNKMKKFGIKPTMPCYTALFNACSNSPWKQDGLDRAKKLRQLMIDKEIQPNAVNYRAMIKAFGLCGDILTAFSLVDEMSLLYQPTEETFAVLLMVCVSDKEAGLKHAIEVWKRMRKRKIAITHKHYNLLLRAVRDCGVGDIEYANTLLNNNSVKGTAEFPLDLPLQKSSEEEHIPWWKWTPKHEKMLNDKNNKLLNMQKKPLQMLDFTDVDSNDTVNISSATTTTSTNSVSAENNVYDNPDVQQLSVPSVTVPNILNPRVKFSSAVIISDVSTPEKRLGLLGGMDGILSHMEKDQVKPDIKTFSQLIDMIPSTRSDEEKLLKALEKHMVKPDTDFVNMLIRKRNLRKDFEGAKSLITWMASKGLVPNIMTYGCLALGCQSKKTGLQLLSDMEKNGVLPNIEIYRTLLSRSDVDFYYKIELLKSMKDTGVKPEKQFLTIMEKHVQLAKHMTVKRERREAVPEKYKNTYFIEGLEKFNMYYAEWLRSQSVDPELHPWHQFRRPTQTADDDNTEEQLLNYSTKQ